MSLSRRHFLQSTAVLLAAPAAAQNGNRSVIDLPFRAGEPRLGIVGTGGRGTSLLRNLLAADVRINALCDVVPEKARAAQALVAKAGQTAPELYTDSDHAFERLLARDDLDAAIVATPWNWHTPVAVFAMEHGKHAFSEVPAATTIEECWKLVDASERTQRHCIMLENCCYGYNELLVLNMVRAGMFGDLLHGEAAYLHDLRGELFSGKGEGLWRRRYHTDRNGNLYPTHGLGPVANYMGIQRGDRFHHLVSMSSPSRGLQAYRAEHMPKDDATWKEEYREGDLNTSLIQTEKGLTITLQHDVSDPLPYDRLNMIQGSKGIFRDYPPRIYLDGQAGGEKWAAIDSYKERFEHPLWKKQGEIAAKLGGHGGMDFMLCYRLAQCMRLGTPPDMDVYDAAAWSAPAPLSQQSVAAGSAPVAFPDFTRGRWRQRDRVRI